MEALLDLNYRAQLGEGIILFPDGLLRWVDLLEGSVFTWDGEVNQLIAQFPHEVAKVLPWRDGFLALGRRSILLCDAFGVVLEQIELHSADSNLRCSDGAILPNGELLLGTVDRDLAPGRGRLLKINLKREIIELARDLTISNGIATLASGRNLVWTDSAKNLIEIFDFDSKSGEITGQAEFTKIPLELGIPDGIAADRDGGIWVALWSGAGILRIDANGEIRERIDVGTPNLTSCAFDRNDDLVATSASQTLSEAELAKSSGAGGLWRVKQGEHQTGGWPSTLALI